MFVNLGYVRPVKVDPSTFCLAAQFKVESNELELELTMALTTKPATRRVAPHLVGFISWEWIELSNDELEFSMEILEWF